MLGMYVQRQTGLGADREPVQRCKQQKSRAFCRPDSGYHQQPTVDPVEVEELEAKGGLERPLDGGVEDWVARAHGIDRLASRLVHDEGQPGPMDAARKFPGTHPQLPRPPPLLPPLWTSWGRARKTSVAPNPWPSAVRHGVADFRRCMQW
jgi:hypothetical protein